MNLYMSVWKEFYRCGDIYVVYILIEVNKVVFYVCSLKFYVCRCVGWKYVDGLIFELGYLIENLVFYD